MDYFDEKNPAPRRARARREKAPMVERPTVTKVETKYADGAADARIVWGKSVVVYARYSKESQGKGNSIETQVRMATEYARKQGWTVAKTFKDEGVTGATSDRAQLKEMLRYLKKHPHTIVIVALGSRIARETDVYIEIKTAMTGLQAHLIIASLGEVSEDLVMDDILDGQKGRHNLATAMRNGKIDSIFAGKCIGNWPYGYFQGTDGRLWPDWEGPTKHGSASVIPPGPASVIQRIFNEWSKNLSLNAIADGLMADGILSPGKEKGSHPDSEWDGMKVHHILKNRTYIGEYTQTVAIFPWERFGENRNISTKSYTIQAPWMRIVSDELFNHKSGRTWKLLPGQKAPSVDYLLSGKIINPATGQTMAITARRDHWQVWWGRRKKDEPTAQRIRYDYTAFEPRAWETLGAMIGEKAGTAFSDRFKSLLQQDYDKRLKEAQDRQERIDQLDAALQELADDGTKARLRGDFDDFFARMRNNVAEIQAEYNDLVEDHMPPDDIPPFDYEGPRASLKDAYALLATGNLPFRPKDEPGLDLLRIASEPFDKVTMVEKPHGRFDVTFHMNGTPWGAPDIKIERTFEDVIVWDSYGRNDRARQNFEAAVADRSLYPDAEFLRKLEPLDELRWRMKGRTADAIHAVILSLKFKFSQLKSSRGSGLNVSQTQTLGVYLRTKDGQRVMARIAELVREPVPQNNYDKDGKTRTLRERWLDDRHPMLRYPLADVAGGMDRIPDAHWDALIAAGIALDRMSLVGRKGKNDRLALETMMLVVRENRRMLDLPPGYTGATMMQRLMRHADEAGITGDLTVCLLKAQGLTDLPRPEDVPPFRNKDKVHVNKRGPVRPAPRNPLVRRPGTRPGSTRPVVSISPPKPKSLKE